VLALGLLALLVPVPLGLVLGPLAWRYARQDIPRMLRAKMDPNGLAMTYVGQAAAVAGMVLGCLLLFAVVVWAVLTLFGPVLRNS
jgi:hypothetical protein